MDFDVWHEADANVWLESLAGHTIESELFALTSEQVVSLSEAAQLSEPHVLALKALEQRIDVALKRFGGRGFVKLSCRSPKDVTTTSFATRALWTRFSKQSPTTDRVALLQKAHLTRLCVQSGEEAVALLKRSHRVKDDLKDALQVRGKLKQGKCKTFFSFFF